MTRPYSSTWCACMTLVSIAALVVVFGGPYVH